MTNNVAGSSSSIPLATLYKDRKRLAEQQQGSDAPTRAPTRFETDISKLKPVKFVSLSNPLSFLRDGRTTSAYETAYTAAAPTAVVDKLKGVLDLADLNRIRSDAGGSNALDADDMTKINEIVDKDMPAHAVGEGADFVRNIYRAYLAQFWSETANG